MRMWWKRYVSASSAAIPPSAGRTNCLRLSVVRCSAQGRLQRLGNELVDGRFREHQPDHRGRLDDRSFLAAEQVETGGDQRLDRWRNDEFGHVRRAPHPLVGQHPDHLLDVQRVALGGLDHATPDLVRHRCLAEQPVDEQLRIFRGQRLELDRCRSRPAFPIRVLLEQLVPGGADQHDRHAFARLDQVIEELEERRGGIVDVVEQDDERLVRGKRFEQPTDPPEQLGHRDLRRGQADRGSDARRDLVALRVVGIEQPEDARLGGLRRCRPRRPLPRLRTASTIGQNVIASPYARHRPRSVTASASCSSRNSWIRRDLPTPGSPTHRHQPAALGDVRVGERLLQDRQLAVAARRAGSPRVSRSAPSISPTSRYAGTRSALPLSSRGSTSSSVDEAATRAHP